MDEAMQEAYQEIMRAYLMLAVAEERPEEDVSGSAAGSSD
jgi:hypothetical protein